MSLRINYINNLLPETITGLSWINDNTNRYYKEGDIKRSKVINYKCSFCHTEYNNAIAYTYRSFLNIYYRCLNCLHLIGRIIWNVYEAARYESTIISIVSKINEKFNEKFTFVNDIEVRNCSGNLCKNKENKEIKGYKFKFNEQDKFLCFMCYCNYENTTGEMSMSRKPISTRKRSNKSTRKKSNKSTRKKSNKKSKSTRKRVNKKPTSTRKK